MLNHNAQRAQYDGRYDGRATDQERGAARAQLARGPSSPTTTRLPGGRGKRIGGGGRGDRSHEHPRPRRTGPTDPRSGLVVDVVGASHVVRPEFTSGGRVCPALGGLTGRCEAAAKCLEPDLVTNVRAHSVRYPVAADSALSNRSSPSKPNSNTDGRITEENPELQLCVSLIGVLRTCRI